MIYLQLFISYLKIGFFGFGGGYSMLSLIQHEVVVNHEWISNAALSDIIAISQMTPGPIAINSATYVGYTVAGFWGSVIATAAVCLPSLTIMVLITRFFLRLKGSNYMECVMTAMRPSVMGMIAAASLLLIFPQDKQGASMIDIWSWILFAAAFVASLRKVNPINLIILSAIAGIGIYYIPTVVAAPSPKVEEQSISPSQAIAQREWSSFDLSQSEVIGSERFEQAWVDFIYLICHQEPYIAYGAIKESMRLCNDNSEALNALFELGERYLYNPNSPMRNDELFIPMLEFMIDSPAVDPLLKIRPKSLLKIAKLNRMGQVANNFTTDGGEQMHQAESPFTILYFHNPDCTDCKRTSAVISRSEIIRELTYGGQLTIIPTLSDNNPQIDTLYDLKAIPSLYLLDEQKRVLLKDATIESIIEALTYIFQQQ